MNHNDLALTHASGYVLVVEDNEINQLVACDMLELFGVRVDTASNGREGVEKAALNGYDLILMDVQMPIMDGLSAARKIREFNREIPIVALTGGVYDEDKEAAFAAGMNAHLAKPIDLDELEALLKQFLRSSPHDAEKQSGDASVILEGFDLSELALMVEPKSIERFLRTFANTYRDSMQSVSSLHPEDEEFAKWIHALKGSSGSVGAKKVYEIAKVMDESRSVPLRETMLAPLLDALKNAVNSVDRVYPPQKG